MDFVDQMILSLADITARATLFDQGALAAIVGSGYDASSISTTGPYSATFDEVDLGPDLSAAPSIAGSWMGIDGMSRVDAHLSFSNVTDSAAPNVAAVWVGSVGAQAVIGDAKVTGIDQHWNGTSSSSYQDTAVLTYTPAAVVGPAAVRFPIMAAVFIVDVNLSLRDLLRQSAQARSRLALARPQAPPKGLPVTAGPTVVWIVNGLVFDDAAWPGAGAGMTSDQARAARRDRAQTWLATQHIAVAIAA